MMMSEYMRPEFAFRKKKDRHSRRSSIFVPNANAMINLTAKKQFRPRKKSLKFTKKLDIETITKSYRDPSELEMGNSPIDSPGGKALKKMSRFALIKKSREPTPTELSVGEADSLNSISRFNSARKIEIIRADETPQKMLTVRSNKKQLDVVNNYVDISHLDYTVSESPPNLHPRPLTISGSRRQTSTSSSWTPPRRSTSTYGPCSPTSRLWTTTTSVLTSSPLSSRRPTVTTNATTTPSTISDTV